MDARLLAKLYFASARALYAEDADAPESPSWAELPPAQQESLVHVAEVALSHPHLHSRELHALISQRHLLPYEDMGRQLAALLAMARTVSVRPPPMRH